MQKQMACFIFNPFCDMVKLAKSQIITGPPWTLVWVCQANPKKQTNKHLLDLYFYEKSDQFN